MMGCFSCADVRRLLHNKYVAVLGDSIQRSVYKDLVKLLQDDEFISENQLRKKGEMSFANDTLMEGGTLGEMHNGITYREVRQYRTGNHLVRFYFLTRVYSDYVESVLTGFKSGPQPDVIIINSCIWDLIRYSVQPLENYKTNLDLLFSRLTEVLSPECLVIWNMTMPVGFNDGEIAEYTEDNLRWDVIEGNFYSATLANLHKMDVLDMHFHFRHDLHYRCKDSIHWNPVAHRKYTQILMAHIAQAWSVQPPEASNVKSAPKVKSHPIENTFLPPVVSLRNVPHPPPQYDQEKGQHHLGPHYLPGYTAFDCTDASNTIEIFKARPNNSHTHPMSSNAFSSFADDNPFLVSPLPRRIGVKVPIFPNHPFSGMTIVPYPLEMPWMNFGTYDYNPPMPRESWRGHHRLPRRRDMRPMRGWIHPYY